MSAAPAPFGFINAFKPPGITSTSFGAWVRRSLGAGALGHWGTLDPAASGVLVLAAGEATRLLPYIASDDKSYVFELRVGARTATGDASGRIVTTSAVPADWADSLGPVLAAMIGYLDQTPPMYSAVKVGGEPLYRAARSGREVDRPARRVTIFALRAIAAAGHSARLTVDCSAGTYVRTLCEQIGQRLGVEAHMGALVRTRSGPFVLDDARTPDEIACDPDASLRDPAPSLSLRAVELSDAQAERFRHGNAVGGIDGRGAAFPETVLVRHGGRPIGIGRLADTLAPVRVLQRGGEN